jgi:hypothetical protein
MFKEVGSVLFLWSISSISNREARERRLAKWKSSLSSRRSEIIKKSIGALSKSIKPLKYV